MSRPKIEEKVPTPSQTKMVKVIKSDSKDENKPSYIEIEGKMRLRIEHVLKIHGQDNKRYLGGISKLKKCFDAKSNTGDPVCAIKIFDNKEYNDRVRNAENEAKYSHLLGRESYWGIMNNKCYVTIPWMKGMNMHDYAKHLQKHAEDSKYVLPFKKPDVYTRLKMFMNYLTQAKIFHDLGLILGDPKSGNAMVDTDKETIEMVDFDAVHPIGTAGTAYTRAYLPPNLITRSSGIRAAYTQADDIYIFGLMLAELFPEIFNVTYTGGKPTRITEITPEPKSRRSLNYLVSYMTDDEPDCRCNINECVVMINLLLEVHAPRDVPEAKGKDQLPSSSGVPEAKYQLPLPTGWEHKFEALLKEIISQKSEDVSSDSDDQTLTNLLYQAFPQTLNQLWLDSEDEDFVPLKMALRHGHMDILEFSFKYFLEAADYKQVNEILKSDFSKPLLNKKLVGDRLPLVIAHELKEDKNGNKERIIDALLKKGALLEEGIDLTICDEQALTSHLYDALQILDLEKIKKIAGTNPKILNNLLPNGLSPVQTIASFKTTSREVQLEIMIFLLKKHQAPNLQIDVTCPRFREVLHEKFWSVLISGDQDTAILLLDHFNNLIKLQHRGSNHESSILMMAAYYNQKEVVQYLIDKKVDVFELNLKDETAEDILRKEKPEHIEMIEILKDAAFLQVLENQDYYNFSLIFKKQKVKNIKFKDGRTPLTKILDCKIITKNGVDIVNELLNENVDNLFNSDGHGTFPLEIINVHKSLIPVVKNHLEPRANGLGMNVEDFFEKKDSYKILKEKFDLKKQEIMEKLNYYKKKLMILKEMDSKSESDTSILLKILEDYEYKSEKVTLNSIQALTSCDFLIHMDYQFRQIVTVNLEPFFSGKNHCNPVVNTPTVAGNSATLFGNNFSKNDEEFIKKLIADVSSNKEKEVVSGEPRFSHSSNT